MKRDKVKNRWQIAVYVPADLEKRLKTLARKEDRSHNATVVDILRRYFLAEDAKVSPDAAQ